MLSLFNGMHRADIMSEIVSGRKPFLSAPHTAFEMEWQMDRCPRSSDSSGCLHSPVWPFLHLFAALLQVQILSFFSGENMCAGKKGPCFA